MNDEKNCAIWFSRTNLPVLAMLALTLVAALLVIKDIVPKPLDRVVSVTASGKTMVRPDKAELRIGVVTQPQKTAAEAVRLGNEQMNKVNTSLKQAGVKADEMQTTNYSLNPRYSYEPVDGQKLDGYELYQELQVKLSINDTNKISDILTAATEAGANQIGDVQFVVNDPDNARIAARNQAIAKAKVKAKQLSKITGMRLGKIVDVLEDQGGFDPIMYGREMALGLGGGKDVAIPAPSVELGQNEISVTVTLVYQVR